MSQKALDLPRSIQTIRRHKILVSIVVVLGILGGAAYAVLKPPMLSSTALIVLPVQQNQQGSGSSTTTTGPDPFTATQEVDASSSQVLLNALPKVHPAMPLGQLRQQVEVGSPAP